MLHLWLVLVLFLSHARPDEAKSSSDSLNRYISKKLGEYKVPSIAALKVTDRGATVETSFWGYANLEYLEAPTRDTAYLLASISKLFVATAVMQLRERGLLGLNDDIDKLLPEDFPSIRNPGYPDVPITIRQLLTHTSSIRDDWNVIDESYVFDAKDPEISLQAFTRAYFNPSKNTKAYRARHKPGSRYHYANMGYELLGVIVEAISGTSFEQFTQANIFEPLGMDPASWLIEGLIESGASIAMPYRWSRRNQEFVPYGHYTFSGAPDGGLRATVDGLGAFMKMILNDGVGPLGERILKKSTVNEMIRQATPVESWQGLGWYESEVAGGGVWGHGGAEQGVSTMLMLDRQAGRGVVVLANGDDAFGEDGDYEMLDRFWEW